MFSVISGIIQKPGTTMVAYKHFDTVYKKTKQKTPIILILLFGNSWSNFDSEIQIHQTVWLHPWKERTKADF